MDLFVISRVMIYSILLVSVTQFVVDIDLLESLLLLVLYVLILVIGVMACPLHNGGCSVNSGVHDSSLLQSTQILEVKARISTRVPDTLSARAEPLHSEHVRLTSPQASSSRLAIVGS